MTTCQVGRQRLPLFLLIYLPVFSFLGLSAGRSTALRGSLSKKYFPGCLPQYQLHPSLLSPGASILSRFSYCPTLCYPMGGNLPGSSVHGIFQARKLEWVSVSYSRGSSQLRNQIWVPCIFWIGRWILYHCTTWEVLHVWLVANIVDSAVLDAEHKTD